MAQSVEELFAALGDKEVAEAVAAHRNDPVRGFAELPEIKSGVAKLLRCEFYNDEGQVAFRAVGEVVAPLYGEGGVPLRGLETAQFAVLPRGNMDKGVRDVLDVFRQMVGQETLDKLITAHGTTLQGLSNVAKGITATTKTNPIYFRFSNKFEENKSGRLDQKTGLPYPGRFWQRWQPRIEGYVPMLGGAMPAASTNGTGGRHTTEHYTPPTQAAPPPWTERTAAPPAKTPSAATKPRDAGADTYDLGAPDVDDLVTRAGADDQSAKDELTAIAAKLGYTGDDVEDATSWNVVGGWITSGTPKGGVPAGKVPFEVGKFVKFLPPDKKFTDPTKRNKIAVDCEVVSVEPDGTTHLRSVAHPDRVWVVKAGDPYVLAGSPQK